MKKILFATDFSKNAEKAFHFALKIAEKHNAKLIMLHVFDVPPLWGQPYMSDPNELTKQAAISWEHRLKELFEKHNSNLKPVYIAIENSSVVTGILSVIKMYAPNLVVTGTRGKSIIKEFFAGSTTKALVKQSPIPVLAIPENAIYRDFEKVLYASDFREADLVAMEVLIELLGPYNPEIRTIHISTDKEYQSNEKMEWFKDLVKENFSYKKTSFELLISDNIYDRLMDYLNQHNLQLLVMLEKERYGFLEEFFTEDLVTKMEFNTSIPLLSFNEHFLRIKEDNDIKKTDTIEQ